jgi:hypothetical protein
MLKCHHLNQQPNSNNYGQNPSSLGKDSLFGSPSTSNGLNNLKLPSSQLGNNYGSSLFNPPNGNSYGQTSSESIGLGKDSLFGSTTTSQKIYFGNNYDSSFLNQQNGNNYGQSLVNAPKEQQ